MKRKVCLAGIILVLLSGVSCTEKFLERNNADWYSLSDSLMLDTFHESASVSIELPDRINADFTVFMRPRWIVLPFLRGRVTNGMVELTLAVDKSNLPYYNHKQIGTVVLEIEDYGYVALTISYTDYGSPTIQCSPSEVVFDGNLSQSFSIFTPSQGILIWEIRDIPEWLTFSKTSGTLPYGQTEWIMVTINEDKIAPGVLTTAAVRITGNSSAGDYLLNISVSASTVPLPGGYTIGSILTDAEYHHESGILAVCTKSPDQVLLFDMTTGVSDTIHLDRTPGCISFSEDGTRAVIGYTVAAVGYIDVTGAEITAEFTIDCVPSDIVLGNDGWCYITPFEDQWETLRNLNLSNGQLITSSNSGPIYEKTEIKKVPGKQYMVGSQLPVSPSSLMIFDISEGQSKDAISQYHEELGHLWPSKDGLRVYSGFGNVYTLPEYDGQFHPNSPPVYGYLNAENNYIHALDECPVLNSVFISSSLYWLQPGNSSLIEQFNTTSLNRIKTFNVQPAGLMVSGTYYQYETCPRFIFVSKEGSEMYVLKTVRPDYEIEGWFLETIEL